MSTLFKERLRLKPQRIKLSCSLTSSRLGTSANYVGAMALVEFVRIVTALAKTDWTAYVGVVLESQIGSLIKTAQIVPDEDRLLSFQSLLKHYRQVGLSYQSAQNASIVKSVNESFLVLTWDTFYHSKVTYAYELCENTSLSQISSWLTTTMKEYWEI